MASDGPGTKQESVSLEDLIWGRQYAAASGEDFEAGARRVGEGVAENDRDALAYTNLITSRKFIPGGRILAGAGSEHGNLLNCFVQDGAPFEDGTTRSVLLLARKLALVTKVGGGNGVNLDTLPPKRRYEGPLGTAWLTISEGHADQDKVRDGTFMDLVRGEYTTQGYKHLRYSELGQLPETASRIKVDDSVDGIWSAAGEMVHALLAGNDVAIDLSNLRQEGTPVAGSGGTSSGPASFAAEIFDNFARWASLGAAEHAGPVATLRYVYAPTLRVIRQGGCLHPDTLVHTSKGTLRLAEIVDEHQIGWQDHYLKVATDQGWKDSPTGFNNGISDTLRVSLHNGQSLRGTARHKLKVMRPDGTREWVQFADLQQGDYVIQSLDQHTGSPVTLQPVDVPHHNATPVEMPTVLTEDVALFLGYLWGDGFISSGRVGYTVPHDSPMIEEGQRLFRELFGLTVSVEQKQDNGSLILVTRSAHLISWLSRNGFARDGAGNLTIPKAVRMSPRPIVGAFLRGLFEADGSLSDGMPALSTSSMGMAEDVAVMLAGIGIPTKRRSTNESRNRDSRHAVHSIRAVSQKGLERFKERVGWIEGSCLAKMGEHIPDEGREQSWLLPNAPALLTEAFAAVPPGVKGAPAAFTQTRETVSSYIRGERKLTATGYDRLQRKAHLEQHLPEPGYDEYYVAVTAVEDAGRSLTLDVSVDDNKTYLAGGFVTHNTRRGAGMATLSATHPDLEDFITCKDLDREAEEGDISTFNISVLAADEFMRRATDQDDGHEAATLREIARHAWQTGEPGVIFIDAINAHNPLTEVDGPIMATNPCGEIPLYPGEPCDLGAINLAAHVVDGRLDSALLTKTARQATRFLDDVLTAEVAPLPEIHDAIQDKRRIGLGVMGLADMLIRLGYRYDSDEGRATVRQVMDVMREAALAESADLAIERGVPEGVRRAGLDRRNIAVFTVAPTGTTSMLAGVSGGVEPVFAATYTRRIGTDYVKVVHPLLEEILGELTPCGRFANGSNWDHEAILEALDEHHGSLQPLLDDLPGDARLDAFVIAHDVAPRDHVLMQATVQRSFDWKSDRDWQNGNRSGRTMAGNSISKTCNLPNQAVVGDVLEAYALAWEEGCKGITVYRDGSRDLQVLTSGSKKEEARAETVAESPEPVAQPEVPQPEVPQAAPESAPTVTKYERQQRMMGITDKVNLVNSSGVRRGFFITVNSDASGQAREVFIVSGKAGDEANGDSEALGRVVSIALQHGVPPEALISTLRGISGGMFGTYHSRIVTSKADLIAVALETAVAPENGDPGNVKPAASRPAHLPAGAEACPHCGAEMRMAEGCMTCTNQLCGWSAC